MPPCFNAALDIRRTVRAESSETVWTQGANFAFAASDTIYDTSDGYKTWSDALQCFKFCITISEATAVGTPATTTGRYPGLVIFVLSKPNESRTGLTKIGTYTMSQDEFVHFLIVGSAEDIQ